MQKILIAGCGYTGERLSKKYIENQIPVVAIVRTEEHLAKLADSGAEIYLSNFDDKSSIPDINFAGTTIFYTVPPQGGGISDMRAKNFIDKMKASQPPEKIIYFSATSVYGDQNGALVTETSECKPASAMGKRRLDAERAFLEYGSEFGVKIIILRISGIYGKGRLPLMQISQQQPLLSESEAGISNRIHIDDLVLIAYTAAEKCNENDMFNVSDGSPSSMTSYFHLCADTLGYKRGEEISKDEADKKMSPLLLSYFMESKIVDSSKLFVKLGIKLKYKDMYAGVSASI